jgi:DNA mismatch repair protein MSH3
MKRQASISSFFTKKIVDKKPKVTHDESSKESRSTPQPSKKHVSLGQPLAMSNTELQQLHAQFAKKFGSLDKEKSQKRKHVDKLMTDIENTEQEIIPHQKFTPLETQVVELKAKYPNCLLLIEVGYKFRFFGQDAKVNIKQVSIKKTICSSFLL